MTVERDRIFVTDLTAGTGPLVIGPLPVTKFGASTANSGDSFNRPMGVGELGLASTTSALVLFQGPVWTRRTDATGRGRADVGASGAAAADLGAVAAGRVESRTQRVGRVLEQRVPDAALMI